MSAALITAIILPALVGAALATAGRFAERIAVPVSLATAAVMAIAATIAAITGAEVTGGVPTMLGAFGSDLRVDALAAVVLPTVAWIGFLVLVFATADRTRPAARFHGLMLLFLAAVVVTVTATGLPLLLAAWEVMGATSYALIGFHWQDRNRVAGGFTAFTVTRAGDLGIYLAAGAVVAGGGAWSLTALQSLPGPWVHVAAAGLLAAGFGKAAQLPFSFWISRAMEGPSAVSALLHSAAMVAMGGYLLLRVEPLLNVTGWAGPTAAWVGVTTAIVLGVIALSQRDLKQVLAASTASQLGFVVLAAGVGSFSGGTAQLVAHAATKALLFLTAGAWLTATGTKQFTGLRGIAARWPAVGVLATVGALSLAGLPPLSLWYAKDVVLAAALEEQPWLYAAGLAGAALAAAYSARIIALLWRRAGTPEASWDDEEHGTRRVPRLAVVPMVVLAVAAAGLALLGTPLLHPMIAPLSGTAVSWPELAASAAIAVVVVLLTLWRTPTVRIGMHWFGLERTAVAVIATPTLRLAAVLARLDDRYGAAVDRSGPALEQTARAVRALDERGPAAVTGWIGSAIAVLGRLARRPQTGQVHHYYIGATVTVAAAAVLLLVVR
ncbi:NADH:ubiquinone oxidoreductase subunit 5 (chain L)/Multisubunit Na+/H+ antiporter, MnhA subunit [Curtobacterium sp. UNCCL20]|uniref:proton-conducting transporter transmembrane domain-containing protein n=1 Tax=Curtobacterium sp. UNCCL20 TaxID=1502773 RepID=UPI00088250BA|nr:proton-conducting transporter membrane subunit [Curtobacterium sp. UNCCL20]SDQ14798.1 NADH:ubiquinone oxidoreductase subunit 5 (chain L)/Multisubunit Na+/H+ antiporter, MnhA subunit [Curtobacterium sp. UNCCL20]